MLRHPSLQDTVPAAREGHSGGEVGWSSAARELGQENLMPDCSRAPNAKGFGVGGSRGMTFACQFTLPCLILAKAHLPVETLSA